MADYHLYYWPLPFRGQFIRALLAFAGKSVEEPDSDAITTMMQTPPADAPIGFMGPPVLIDHGAGDFALSQMPAIMLYLGDTLGLLPDDARLRALSIKVVNDANDVLDEITLNGGREMWTAEKWHGFLPRLQRWMAMWEALGRHHGVTQDAGTLLGTPRPGVADIATAILWCTMADRFPPLARLLKETAPNTAALSRRTNALPALAALDTATRARYGDAYCGGQIEKSLRAVLEQA